jgi:hypothetical protein
MAESRIYLNVPYAEKDAAKALGAKWDAERKKWYVPATKDSAEFAKWLSETAGIKVPSTKASKVSDLENPASANTASGRVTTYPKTPDFVPYNGDEPPWL